MILFVEDFDDSTFSLPLLYPCDTFLAEFPIRVTPSVFAPNPTNAVVFPTAASGTVTSADAPAVAMVVLAANDPTAVR